MSGETPTRWGIVATGGIARSFVEDLALLDDAEAVAVGSRTAESAESFGERYGVPNRHASYEALVEDPDVDAVYISTPHPGHHAAARLAIEAGKAVLVEKPFTMDAAEAEDLITLARANGVFLMEAMWARWLPHMVEVRRVVESGELGEIISVTAEHGQWFPHDPEFRLFKPELGGGALLDLGIYPVSFASMVLGAPTTITAVSSPAFTGVDAQTSMIFTYGGSAHAVLTTTSYALTENAAAINGTDARMLIDGTFYRPSSARVIDRSGKVLERIEVAVAGNGLRFEAAEVGRCLREGLLESPVLPLGETLTIMRTMDEIRRQIGLSY